MARLFYETSLSFHNWWLFSTLFLVCWSWHSCVKVISYTYEIMNYSESIRQFNQAQYLVTTCTVLQTSQFVIKPSSAFYYQDNFLSFSSSPSTSNTSIFPSIIDSSASTVGKTGCTFCLGTILPFLPVKLCGACHFTMDVRLDVYLFGVLSTNIMQSSDVANILSYNLDLSFQGISQRTRKFRFKVWSGPYWTDYARQRKYSMTCIFTELQFSISVIRLGSFLSCRNASKRVRIFDARTRQISEGSSKFSMILAVYAMQPCMLFLWIPHSHTTVSAGCFSCTLRLLLSARKIRQIIVGQCPAMVHSVDCNPLTATYCTILQHTSLVHKVTRTNTTMIHVFRMTFEISRTE